MFLIKDAYATVWSVEDKGNYVESRISTSEKDRREEGKYINSNWFARFVGKAKDPSLTLSERSKIKILSGKISTTTTGEGANKKTYTNVVVFDFEILGGTNYSNTNSQTNGFYSTEDDELPF